MGSSDTLVVLSELTIKTLCFNTHQAKQRWYSVTTSCPPEGGGALQCFRYRVCAAGQGIVFTILAPEPGIVFCKYAPKRVYSFKFLLPDRTTVYFLDPLLPDGVWFFAILLPDGGI